MMQAGERGEPAEGDMVKGWRFGEISIDRVLEFERPLFPLAALYPDARPEALRPAEAWLVPRVIDPAEGLLVMAFHTFVVRARGRTILVDTCSGNDKPRPQKPRYHRNRWPYLERLAAIGVSPAGVDIVVSTHLHVDHVGWNTRLVPLLDEQLGYYRPALMVLFVRGRIIPEHRNPLNRFLIAIYRPVSIKPLLEPLAQMSGCCSHKLCGQSDLTSVSSTGQCHMV
jgi:glyoxylase-like metal-dependent hydrolase (beta-lactamase superfamily II)